MNPAVQSNVFDVGSLTALKRQVAGNDPQALRAAAQQFEALFLQQVLKSMRDATPQDGIFDSEQTRMYQSLLDQQLSQVLSTKANGTGLASLIEKQLSRQNEEAQAFPDGLPFRPASPALPLQQRPLPLTIPANGGLPAQPGPAIAPPATSAPLPSSAASPATTTLPGNPAEFARSIWPQAVEASSITGIPARFMVGHAALESGWGKSAPRFADGRPSFNLFGIKAGTSWSGPVVQASTTEYVNGVPQARTESFRAYASYADAFRDYAALLASNPRYAAVIGSQDSGQFARGLQRAGYATDPQYASKLQRIIAGDTLRTSLSG